MPTIENSVHPYVIGTDETQQVTISGSHHVFLTLDALSDLAPLDAIYVIDENDNVVWPSGFQNYQLTDLKLSIVGATLKVRLDGANTDGSYYGYRGTVDNVSDITGPYLIDSTNFQKWALDATGLPGPYFNGSDRYMVMKDFVDSEYDIFKSTDGGLTWSSVHQLTDAQYGYAQPGSSASKIRICYDSWAVNHKWVIGEWDMATDTWSEITTYTDVVDTTGYVYNQAAGVDHVFYRPTVQGDLWLRNYNGSWDGGTEISDNVAYPPYLTTIGAACADEDGDLHIVFRSTTTGTSYDVFYRQYKTNGSLTTVVTLLSGVASVLSRFGRIAFTGDYIVIAYHVDDPGRAATWTLPAVLSGTDYHDDVPTFASYTLADTFNNSAEIMVATGPSDGLAYVFWLQITQPGDPPTDQIRYVTFDGTTAGDVQIVHDEIEYPSPTNDISGQFQHDLGQPVWNESAQAWEFHLALEYNPLGTNDQWCTGFMWSTALPMTVGGAYSLLGIGAVKIGEGQYSG